VTGALASTFSDTTLPVLIIAGCVTAAGALGLVRWQRRRRAPATTAAPSEPDSGAGGASAPTQAVERDSTVTE
jgi:hypothetical protein